MGYMPGVGGVGAGCGAGVGGIFWTSAGIILVLYILLVIVLRGGFF